MLLTQREMNQLDLTSESRQHCGTSLLEMCLCLFLAKSPLEKAEVALREGIIKHLYLLAVDPERPQTSPKL